MEYVTLLLTNGKLDERLIAYDEFESTIYHEYVDSLEKTKSVDNNNVFDAFIFTREKDSNNGARAQASALTLEKGDAFNHVPEH